MKTSCNPGRWLLVEGSFELGTSLAEWDALPAAPGLTAPQYIAASAVRDRESGEVVGLVKLLHAFLEDPAEKVTGPIRITIEAGP